MTNKKHSIRIIFLVFGILFGLIFSAEAIPQIWLNDLEDCNVPSPNDGDVLTYNTSSANWSAKAPTTGKNNLNELNDVDVTGVLTDDFLKYNGSGWNDFSLFNTVNTWLQNQTFNENITVTNNVTASYYFGNGSYLTGLPSGGAVALNDLTDVDTTGVQADDFLQYNGTGWEDFDLFNTVNIWLQNNVFNRNVFINQDLLVQNDIFVDSNTGSLYLSETQLGQLYHDSNNLILTQTGRNDIMIVPSGIINLPQQSACRVTLPFGGQIIPANAWIILNLQAVNYDNQAEWNSITQSFIPTEIGLYQIDYSIYLEWVQSATLVQFGIFVNNVLSGGYQALRVGSSGEFALSGADCLQLLPNDIVDLRVFHGTIPQAFAPSQTYTNYIAIHKLS